MVIFVEIFTGISDFGILIVISFFSTGFGFCRSFSKRSFDVSDI